MKLFNIIVLLIIDALISGVLFELGFKYLGFSFVVIGILLFLIASLNYLNG
jgi:hypothetical protein